MKAALAISGAGGQIGRWAVTRAAQAIRAGQRVLVLSRRDQAPADFPDRSNLHWCSLAELAPWRAERLLHAAPLETLPELAQALQPTSIAAFSSHSLISKQVNGETASGAGDVEAQEVEQGILATLARAEDAAEALLSERCRAVYLFRPTLIYGAGLDHTVTRLYRLGQRFRVLPVPANGTGLRQPVHADDLAQCALAALQRTHDGFFRFDIGGGEQLSTRAMATRLVAALPKRAWVLPLAVPILRLAMSLPPVGRGLSPSLLQRMPKDQVVDNRLVVDTLGLSPRPFSPCADDFLLPAWTKPAD